MDWERKCYLNGLPDEVPNELKNLVPSYKLIAITILKNDYALIGLGFQQPKSKVYSMLKRIEISKRITNQPKQLSLF
jgi:predicted phosphoadenosine phosphosulfate sulfurtransferase